MYTMHSMEQEEKKKTLTSSRNSNAPSAHNGIVFLAMKNADARSNKTAPPHQVND